MIIESPYAGDTERNAEYAKACMRDSLERGEAPFASHLLYTQVLDDGIADQRALGMQAGFAWGLEADLVAVYVDLGVSAGMLAGIKRARGRGIEVVERQILPF